MGDTVVLSLAQVDRLTEVLRESNPTLSNEDIDQLMGEVMLGRSFRSQVCPQCGGRKRVVTYPDGISSPVWSDCECNPVRGQSSSDRNPEEVELGERVSMLVQELIGSEKRCDIAEIAIHQLRIELQQARQEKLRIQETIQVLSKQVGSLSALLKETGVLLTRAAPLLNGTDSAEVLLSDIEKFLADK